MTFTVALYVSGHGYGHAVRSAEVATALLRRGARVVVRSDAPRWLFPEAAEYVPGEAVDVGVAQHDGLDLDIDETRHRWVAFAATFEARAEVEASRLREEHVDFVLGDIPPLAFAAAARAGVPNAAIGNFTWDWIYAAWPRFEEAIACVKRGYRQADVLLRLALHSTDPEAFAAFGTIEDVPLIARRAQRSRASVREELRLDAADQVVLLSFGAFDATGLDLHGLAELRDYRFVVTPPLATRATDPPSNVVCLQKQPDDYASLLAACDVVVTKPGYGIVADCLANRIAVLFTSRGPFREYDVLAHALQTLGRARYVPREDVLAGRLADHLAALAKQTNPWANLPMNGAEVIAENVFHRIATTTRAQLPKPVTRGAPQAR